MKDYENMNSAPTAAEAAGSNVSANMQAAPVPGVSVDTPVDMAATPVVTEDMAAAPVVTEDMAAAPVPGVSADTSATVPTAPVAEKEVTSMVITVEQRREYFLQDDRDRLSSLYTNMRRPGQRLTFLTNLKTYSEMSRSTGVENRISDYELEKMILHFRYQVTSVSSPAEYRQFVLAMARMEARLKRGIYMEYQKQLAEFPLSDPNREMKALWIAQNGVYGMEMKALFYVTKGTDIQMDKSAQGLAPSAEQAKELNNTTIGQYAGNMGIKGKDLDEFCWKNGYDINETISQAAERFPNMDEDTVMQNLEKEAKAYERHKFYQSAVNYYLAYRLAASEQSAIISFWDTHHDFFDLFDDLADWIKGDGKDRVDKREYGDYMYDIERKFKFGRHGRAENLTPEQMKYEEFMMKRLGGMNRIDEASMRETFVMVLAAHSLSRMNVTFSEREIKKMSMNINKMYALDNFRFENWRLVLRSRSSVINTGAKIRRDVYGIKDAGLENYAKQMKVLKNAMSADKSQGEAYQKFASNVNRVVAIAESSTPMSPAKREMAIRKANASLVDSIDKYVDTVKKTKKNVPTNENLNHALDALSIVNRFTTRKKKGKYGFEEDESVVIDRMLHGENREAGMGQNSMAQDGMNVPVNGTNPAQNAPVPMNPQMYAPIVAPAQPGINPKVGSIVNEVNAGRVANHVAGGPIGLQDFVRLYGSDRAAQEARKRAMASMRKKELEAQKKNAQNKQNKQGAPKADANSVGAAGKQNAKNANPAQGKGVAVAKITPKKVPASMAKPGTGPAHATHAAGPAGAPTGPMVLTPSNPW